MRAPCVAILLWATVARADSVDDLVAKGQALAQDHDYTRAIELFKEADRQQPRASHACMIGLAYMRRELWPQAELFLALCEKRAVPGDQPPKWIDEAEQQLAAKLSAARIPAITIAVSPPEADAKLTVSSFAPDEKFAPQTIHLAPGKHVIEVSAKGYDVGRQEIEVLPGEPRSVTFTLHRTPGAEPPPAPAPVVPAQPRPRGDEHEGPILAPWIVLGGGVVLAAAAGIYDYADVGPARDRVAHAESRTAYDALESNYSTKRAVAIGLAGGAALMIATGLILHKVMAHDAPPVTAHVAPAAGGGAVLTVGWSR